MFARIILLILVSLLTHIRVSKLAAQNKSAANWILGYDHEYDDDPLFGGTLISFSNNVLDTMRFEGILRMGSSNSSISNSSTGELLFYTNGLHVANVEHDYMLNGAYFDNEEECCNGTYQIGRQGTLILPDPGDSLRYYIFQGSKKFIEWNPYDGLIGLGGWNKYYSIVDMRGDNGLGEVVSNLESLITDTLEYAKMTATRHANGRDWWLLFPEYRSNRIYRVLLAPNGPQLLGVQELPVWIGQGAGTSTFSPDGSQYLRFSNYMFGTEYLHLFDFDRCSGFLSNARVDTIRDIDYAALGGGAAFSPSGRFVYVSLYREVFQYDTWADDFFDSRQLVATYDGFRDTLVQTDTSVFSIGTVFNTPSLAPDGKIYINAVGSVRYLHVIDNPDSLGLACNVVQHGIHLPSLNLASIPVFPHYELGALEGSSCDTLGMVNSNEEYFPLLDFGVYPNPASDRLYLEWSNLDVEVLEIQLTDIHGRVWLRRILPAYLNQSEICLNDYPPGLYAYVLTGDNVVLKRGKIIKMNDR